MSTDFQNPRASARGAVNRDLKFLHLASSVAAIFSKDPNTKVGAVAVGERINQVAIGYNGYPPGVEDDDSLYDRARKLALILHAEENALGNATFPVATLYTTKPPCQGCALRILAARTVRRVVSWADDPRTTWAENQKAAAALLTAAGIEVVVVERAA